jgi:hypothetical protein
MGTARFLQIREGPCPILRLLSIRQDRFAPSSTSIASCLPCLRTWPPRVSIRGLIRPASWRIVSSNTRAFSASREPQTRTGPNRRFAPPQRRKRKDHGPLSLQLGGLGLRSNFACQNLPTGCEAVVGISLAMVPLRCPWSFVHSLPIGAPPAAARSLDLGRLDTSAWTLTVRVPDT